MLGLGYWTSSYPHAKHELDAWSTTAISLTVTFLSCQ